MGHQPGDLPACQPPGNWAIYIHTTSDGRWVTFWSHKAMWIWVKTRGY